MKERLTHMLNEDKEFDEDDYFKVPQMYLYLAVCSNEHLDRMFPLPQKHCQMSNITLDK